MAKSSSDRPGTDALVWTDDDSPDAAEIPERRVGAGAIEVLRQLVRDGSGSATAARILRAGVLDPQQSILARDWVVVLEQAEGDLALCEWDASGLQFYGYWPRTGVVDDEPFDAWWYNGAKREGRRQGTARLSHESLHEVLDGAAPDLVVRERTALDDYVANGDHS